MTTTSLAVGPPVPPDGAYRWMGCSVPYRDYPAFGDDMLHIAHFWQLVDVEPDHERCTCGHPHEDHLDEDGYKGPLEIGCRSCACEGFKPEALVGGGRLR